MKMQTSAVALSVAIMLAAPGTAMAQDSEDMQAELAQIRADMAAMAQRVTQLESELAQAEAKATAATNAANAANTAATQAAEAASQAAETASAAPIVEWKGAPKIKGEGGWSFKPRGRLNIDAGLVSAPDSAGTNDGFDAEARRIRMGFAGDVPGGFGYKVEADFAENEVALTDAIITYKDGGLTISAGQHNTFQGLEELSSSLHTSFIERSAWTDAFGFERRVGLSAQYATKDVLIQAGVFSDNSEDLPNNNWSLDGRFVYSPKIGNTQLHFGGSIHHNELGQGSTVRYRQRPLVHFNDDRFVNTDRFSATSETGYGLEAAAISGPFHIAVEGFSQNVARPTGFADPSFFGGSVELGYFFTGGDKRGYKKGVFDRVKPTSPVGEGGLGAVQANIRYDHLDLNDAGILGGIQDSYQASLIWTLTDYARLLVNYAILDYQDAAFPAAGGDTDYSVDVVGMRAQIDF